MLKKYLRIAIVLMFCIMFFVEIPSMAAFQQWNGSSVESNSPQLNSMQAFGFGHYESKRFTSFVSGNRKTNAFLRHLSLESVLSYFKKITADDDPSKGRQNIVDDYKSYLTLEKMIEQAIVSAANAASEELTPYTSTSASAGEQTPSICKYTSPGWKYFAAILPIINGAEDFEQLLVINAATSDGITTYTIGFEKMQQAAMKLAGDDGAIFLQASSAYAYLLTVYSESGKPIRFIQPKLPDSMQKEIVYPLESTIRIRKSWYAKRDGGARKHTGTDIHANEGTEIYSCTDGVVLYIGYAAVPGYYVIVEDELGYEYHYYHMVCMTDFLQAGQTVKAGELIGHVGNTGNSSVNHLHITIVAPNGQYIDPYSLMVAAKKRAN